MSSDVVRVTLVMDARAFEHQVKVGIFKAYRLRPHQIGYGDMGCACHPAPNPAARDYRRRTKHRNRRRK